MTSTLRFPVGCIHHATHLKQSPPLDGDEFRLEAGDARAFMVEEITTRQT
jgi:hypothetical protein